MKHIYTLVLLLFTITSSKAQFIFSKDSLPEKISILKYASIADAGQKEFSIQQVRNSTANLKFKALRGNFGNLGFTDHTFWIKFDLINKLNVPVLYFLETAEAVTDNVNLYQFNKSGKLTIQQNGDKLDFSKRQINHRKTLFKIELLPGEHNEAYLEVKNDGEKNTLPLNLISQKSLLQSTYSEQYIMGIFYGILFIIAITYLFFYFALKELSFLYYSLYVIFMAACQFALDGFFHQYVISSNSWFNLHAVIIFAIFGSYFFGKYSELILQIKENNKPVHYIFKGIYITFAITLVGILLIPSFLKYSYPIVNILTLLGMVLIVVAIVNILIKKQELDLFYTAGISILFICFTVVILLNFGVLSNSLSNENITKFGIGLEIIALSLAMANRIRLLKTKEEELQTIALQKSEEMNDMKSYFLSNMSHELRTPLNAILGLTNIMENESVDSKVKENCEVIKNAANNLLSSVSDILDFSTIEQGGLKLGHTRFEPFKIIEKLCVRNKNLAEAAGLTFNFSSNLVTSIVLLGDQTRLEQILNNILTNAIKFTSSGSINFTVKATTSINGKQKVVFEIADTGLGITPEKLSSIFEMFSQVNVDNKRKFGGFGIGLCLVKALVELHNGTIDLKSKVEKGTTCIISIDFEIAPEEIKPINIFSADSYDLMNKHVLVVEDNPMNQMVLKMMLKKWQNTTISFANDGSEGLEAILNKEIDIVLLDLQMPVMDGYEAAEAIRAGKVGDKNINLPIIVLTADMMDSTRERVFKLGVNDYMNKPVDQKMLYQKITALLS